MNPVSRTEAVDLARATVTAADPLAAAVEVAVCPPFPWLVPVAEAIAGSTVGLGAQECHWLASGAHTGDVSSAMLAGWCGWVILGHSERRNNHGETDADVARKLKAAREVGLGVIVCVGENEEQYVAGRTAEIVEAQLRGSLETCTTGGPELVVAYEPVWAIGTGRNADPPYVAETLALIRSVCGRLSGEEPTGLRILYGGSVNAGNVGAYVGLDDCDGCLVGGASLKADEFARMQLVAAGE